MYIFIIISAFKCIYLLLLLVLSNVYIIISAFKCIYLLLLVLSNVYIYYYYYY